MPTAASTAETGGMEASARWGVTRSIAAGQPAAPCQPEGTPLPA